MSITKSVTRLSINDLDLTSEQASIDLRNIVGGKKEEGDTKVTAKIGG